jgi:peptide-methionine (S)-S-oxide reductase
MDNEETAFLAGGCTWIMQPLLGHPEGVISTRIGFLGGEEPNPDDQDCGGYVSATG